MILLMANGAFYIDCDRSFLIALFLICMAPLWDLFLDFYFYLFFTFDFNYIRSVTHEAIVSLRSRQHGNMFPKKKQSCPLVCILKYIYEAPSFYYLIFFFPPYNLSTAASASDCRWSPRRTTQLTIAPIPSAVWVTSSFYFSIFVLVFPVWLRWHFYSDGNALTHEREREKSICFMSVCKIKAKKNKTTAFQFFLMISTFQHPFGFVRQPSEFFSEFQMGAHDLFAIRFYTSPCMFYIYAPPVSPFLRKIFNKNKNREREREKTTLQFLWFQVL